MAAKIITVFNQKGGAGKSTITMQLAGASERRGYKTLVIDMDPQGTSSRWAVAGPEGSKFPATVISLAAMEGKMHREVKNHIEGFEVILIDCPPAVQSAAPSSALLVSDLALIPVIPSPADMWAAVAAKKLVENAQVTNDTLIARVVPSAVQNSTSLARELIGVMSEDDEFPVTKTRIRSLAAFRDCQLLGTTVHEVPRATAAIDDVESLTSEVFDLVGLKQVKEGV